MASTRPPILDLPVGDTENWELNINEHSIKSIPESLVILQSLRQSRERWLSMFPKFSSKSRTGKGPELVPPFHTIQQRGRCDLHIGPHIFLSTAIYEAHYTGAQNQVPTYSQGANKAWPVPALPSASSTTAIAAKATSTPSLAPVSSDLISQVNTAALSNPTLANLLQLAAAGKASPEQLRTLGVLMQSLASITGASFDPISTTSGLTPAITATNLPQAKSEPATANTTPAVSTPKPFDLVIEFLESTDRFIFPRGPVLFSRMGDHKVFDTTYDISITTRVPFSESTGQSSVNIAASAGNSTPSVPEVAYELATFVLKRAPVTVWDTIGRWVGGEERLAENKRVLDSMKSPPIVYLAHHLAEGALLTQLRNASATPFENALRSIKPGPSGVAPPRPKRKPPVKKPPKPADTPTGTVDATLVTTGSDSNKRPRLQSQPGAQASTSASSAQSKPKPKAKAPKPSTPSVQIKCISCEQTDVPLILGGRFCRPCVESKRNLTFLSKPPADVYRFNPYLPYTTILAPSMGTAAPIPPASTPAVPAATPAGPPTNSEPPDTKQ